MRTACELLSCLMDDIAIIHFEDKGFNCIDYNGKLLLSQFYDDIQRIEKKVGRSKEEYTIQEFLLVRDKETHLYGLFDSTLKEIFPTEYEYIELISPSLSLEDPIPTQVITGKSHNERWTHIDLVTGCRFESDTPDHGISAIYDNFHCFCGFEANKYHISKCPLWLEYEAHLPDGGWSYDENSYWDSKEHIYYIIDTIKGTAVSFRSNTDDLWKTLSFGQWDSDNMTIISPNFFRIPDDWKSNVKEITLCEGFKLKTDCDCDGWWSMTLIEDRCL